MSHQLAMVPLRFGSPAPIDLGAAVDRAITTLRQRGHAIEATDIPGLFRVSGYPELTVRQLLQVAG